MTQGDVLDATGRIIEHHDTLSVVPNALTAYRLTEGPRGRDV